MDNCAYIFRIITEEPKLFIMKKLFFLGFPLFFFVACQDNAKQEENTPGENSLFEISFNDYKELDVLDGFEKESDTSVNTGNWPDEYRLMHLQKNLNNLILFYKIAELDSVTARVVSYRALDTVYIKNLKEDERVTVGYCYHEDFNEGEVIAIIQETDSLYSTAIKKAWRANPGSEKIEVLKNHDGIKCLNEFFEGENATLPLEKIS